MRDRAVVPLVAASLSTVAPGAGQLYLRRWRRGVLMLGVAMVVAAAGALLWRRGTEGMVEALVRPGMLPCLLIGNVLVAAFRLACVVDAWRLARRRTAWVVRWHRALGRPVPRAGRIVAGGPVLALIAVLLIAPHVVAGYAGATAYNVLTSVFTDPSAAAAGRAQTAAPVSMGTSPTALAEAPDSGGRLTVLLLGGDAGPGRTGLRTDTMMVVTADPGSGRVVMVALPRNLRGVPLPGVAGAVFPEGRFPETLNALYPFAMEHPELFPRGRNPGAMAVKATAEHLLGLPIQRYALVDLAGFVDVIDAVGGVTVQVTGRVNDRLSAVRQGDGKVVADLRPGWHHLNGKQALVYVRSRSATNDYNRMHRQRCLLAALADQANPAELLSGLPHLAEVVVRSVDTDIQPSELPRLARLVANVKRGEVVSLAVVPPHYAPRDAQGYPTVRPDRIRVAVRQAIEGRMPAATPVDREEGSESLAAACP